MAKHKHQTLLDSGMLENTITGMMRAGLLRYEGCGSENCDGMCNRTATNYADKACGMLWTLKPPSKWSRWYRSQWKRSPFRS